MSQQQPPGYGYPPPQHYGQPPGYPPRVRRKSRVGRVVLIILGVLALGPGILVGTCIGIATHQTPEQKKAAAEAASAAASVAAQDKVDLEVKARKGCNKKTGPIFPIFARDFDAGECHTKIDESLKVPGSSDFPWGEVSGGQAILTDGCKLILKSHFDAKNAFGVMVRTSYTCTYNPLTGSYSVVTE